MVSAALLQLFSPFDTLSQQQLDRLLPLVRLDRLSRGQFLIKRGKPLDAIHYLVAGAVDLVDSRFDSETITAGDDRRCYPLTPESPSPVSAKIKSDADVLVVDHKAFELVSEWHSQPDSLAQCMPVMEEQGVEGDSMDGKEGEGMRDWMTCLLNSSLFAQVPAANLQQLFARFEPIEVEAGELIIKESEAGENFYVVESGRARIHSCIRGDITTLGPGQFFGEEALVGDTIRNASVTMDTDGVLMQLSKEDFKSLLQEPLLRYIDGQQLNRRLLARERLQLLDVRLAAEYRNLHVKDSSNLPLASLRAKIPQLDPDITYVITDDGGKRSEVAAQLLAQAGLSVMILRESFRHYLLGETLHG